jgi:ferric-dicitrate binding protein FerR (iron transport regulator)
MTPNQQLEFTYATKKMAVRTVNAEDEIAWKQGLLKYRTISFASLAEELGKVYGVSIVITNNKLKDPSVTVSGSFEESQSLDDILRIVARSLPVKWSKKEGTYYIK